MQSAEIARRWLAFFEERGHTVVPSAPLIADDPTLLLVNAGMVPFKPYFLGEATPPWPRATSVQKCVRTLDIEEVGKTTRHGSFFQMAGNFSFGDYFKERAIPLAWELLTRRSPTAATASTRDRLWVTVYQDDDEAARIWRDDVGLPPERIQRRGKADNYWSMGVPGPCGPCSEIYYDRGPEYGVEGGPVADEERYLEVWNLVFMQYERGAVPGKEDFAILGRRCPRKNIDTGMGLERMATILQGVDNLYEIDTTRPILDRAGRAVRPALRRRPRGRRPAARGRRPRRAPRSCSSATGSRPATRARGYVLRRILRRIMRNMRLLGAGDEPRLLELIGAAIDAMGAAVPRAGHRTRARIQRGRRRRGGSRSSPRCAPARAIFDARGAGGRARHGGRRCPATQAFTLHDTYGFPIDLTLEMAAEQGLHGRRGGLPPADGRAAAAGQGRRAGARRPARRRLGLPAGARRRPAGRRSPATPRSSPRRPCAACCVDGAGVPARAAEGDEVELVLDRTPFYAEGGGQLADQRRHRARRRRRARGRSTSSARCPASSCTGRACVRGEVACGDAAHARGRRRAAAGDQPRAHRHPPGAQGVPRGARRDRDPGRLRERARAGSGSTSPRPSAVPSAVLRDVEARGQRGPASTT